MTKFALDGPGDQTRKINTQLQQFSYGVVAGRARNNVAKGPAQAIKLPARGTVKDRLA